MADGYLNINNNVIGKIPVSNEFNRNITSNVDLIINKSDNASEIIDDIDVLIYKDFKLTYKEVLIIDPNFNLSKQEYDNYEV